MPTSSLWQETKNGRSLKRNHIKPTDLQITAIQAALTTHYPEHKVSLAEPGVHVGWEWVTGFRLCDDEHASFKIGDDVSVDYPGRLVQYVRIDRCLVVLTNQRAYFFCIWLVVRQRRDIRYTRRGGQEGC